jgi:hypothetical protein
MASDNPQYAFEGWGQFVRSATPRAINHYRSYHNNNYLAKSNGPDDHRQQLANSSSSSAIHASLRSAFLTKYQPAKSTPWTMTALKLQEVGNLLGLQQLQCVLVWIQNLCDNAEIINQPFSYYLSRAMIGARLGDIQRSTLHGLDTFLRLEPDQI